MHKNYDFNRNIFACFFINCQFDLAVGAEPNRDGMIAISLQQLVPVQ